MNSATIVNHTVKNDKKRQLKKAITFFCEVILFEFIKYVLYKLKYENYN